MTLDELSTLLTAGAHVDLEVHALDPMLYVAYRLEGGNRTPLRAADGTVLQFRSRYAAQRSLREAGAAVATFIHRSAYGEMIGLDTAGQESELRETMVLADE
jgi:hypothetical protein